MLIGLCYQGCYWTDVWEAKEEGEGEQMVDFCFHFDKQKGTEEREGVTTSL